MDLSHCKICGVEAKLKCSGCKAIAYCDKEHQKKDWKQHKLECQASKLFEIGKNVVVGRYLFATKDIPKGTVLLTENPIVIGPKWSLDEREQNSAIVPCVGCFEMVQIGRAKCPDCGWPACKADCAGLRNTQLHAIECPILVVGRGPAGKDLKSMIDYYRYDSLLALKCLVLQKRQPKKWEELMKLESHYEQRKNTAYYEDAEKRVINYLRRNFLDTIKALEEKSQQSILPDCEVSTLHKIMGIIEVNSIAVELLNGQEVAGMYPLGCMFEHSCIPSCYYSFDMTKGFKINFKTGKDVVKGDHLSITYTNALWGTYMRRDHLKTNKYFLCSCERCKDPTELGTYLSALKCFGVDNEPCGGYQLPIDPLAENEDWACNKCPVRISQDQVNFITGRMGEEVDQVLARQPTVRELEDMIEKLTPFLHKNHYLMFNLKHSLIAKYGNDSGHKYNQLSDNKLNEKIKICEELLQVADILDPNSFRLALYTTILFNELHSGLIELNRRKLDKGAAKTNEEIQKAYRKALNCLMRAKSIIQVEIQTPQGRKLNETVCEALKDVESIIVST